MTRVRYWMIGLCESLLISVAACESREPAQTPIAVHDSAGIRIVETPAQVWKKGEEWRLSSKPTLEIGTVQGPTDTRLFNVRGAARLPDGRIVVATGSMIRWFDAEGRFLQSAGGVEKGKGPGELSQPGALRVSPEGDVLIYDDDNRRITRFGPAGEYAGDTNVSFPSGVAPRVFGLMPDGSIIYRLWRPPKHLPPQGTVVRTFSTVIVDREPEHLGQGETRIGPVPAEDVITIMLAGRPSVGWPLLGRSIVVAVGSGALYVGDDSRWEIRRYAFNGQLRAISRRIGHWVKYSREYGAALLERAIEATTDDRTRSYYEAVWKALPPPEHLPAFVKFTVGSGGDVWIEPRRLGRLLGPRSMLVFGSDGAWLGEVALPDRFSPSDIGDDYVLGVYLDDLEVEHVRLYRLQKPASSPS